MSPADEIAMLRKQLEGYEALKKEHAVVTEDKNVLNTVLSKMVPVMSSVSEVFSKHGASLVAADGDDDTLEILKESMDALGAVKDRLSGSSKGSQSIVGGAGLLVARTMAVSEQVEQVFSSSRELVSFKGPQSVERLQLLGKKQVIMDGETFLGLAQVFGQQLVDQTIRGNLAENRSLTLEAQLAKSKQETAEERLRLAHLQLREKEAELDTKEAELDTLREKLSQREEIGRSSANSTPQKGRRTQNYSRAFESPDSDIPEKYRQRYLSDDSMSTTSPVTPHIRIVEGSSKRRMNGNGVPKGIINSFAGEIISSPEVMLSAWVERQSPIPEFMLSALFERQSPIVVKDHGETVKGTDLSAVFQDLATQEKVVDISSVRSNVSVLLKPGAGRAIARANSKSGAQTATITFAGGHQADVDLTLSKNARDIARMAEELLTKAGLGEFEATEFKQPLIQALTKLYKENGELRLS